MPASYGNDSSSSNDGDMMKLFTNFSLKSFLSLIEKSSDIITILDRGGMMRFISPSIKQVYGFDPESLIGKSAFALVYPDDLPDVTRLFEELVKSPGKVMKVETRLVQEDGFCKWTEGICTNMLDDPAVRGIVCNFRDTTDRKRYEDALSLSREKFRLLAENSEDMIARYDNRLRYLYVNKALEKQTGIPQESFTGKSHAELGIAPEMMGWWETELNMVLETGKTKRVTFKRSVPEGEKFFQAIIIPEFTADGEVASVLCTTRDLTELKKKEEALEELNEDMNTFLYKASHDLRGPIVTIQGLVNIAGHHKENIESYLNLIYTTTIRLDKTLENLKTIVRIRNGKVYPAPIDFSLLVKKVLRELEPMEGFTKMNYRVHVEKEVPVFFSDSNLLSVIFYNLIHNSICYRNELSDSGTVSLDIRFRERHLYLDVEDFGMGIHEDIKDKIYKMFYRGNHKSSGAGLGLYIVKSAVELLGGHIDLLKTEGGTRFKVVLPDLQK